MGRVGARHHATRLLVGSLCLVLLGACSTVRVNTTPEDASIEANGKDISDTGEFKEGLGFKDHTVVVRAKGYKTQKVSVPRQTMVPWLRWTALVGSMGCATVGACAGCSCGGLCCNRNLLASILGGLVGGVLSLGGLEQLPLNVLVVNSQAPDWWTLPGMALGTAVGLLPLTGLLLPFVYLHAPDEVTVTLQPRVAQSAGLTPRTTPVTTRAVTPMPAK